jgi:hypothetical protein
MYRSYDQGQDRENPERRMNMETGFDRFLENQFGWSGDFFRTFFEAAFLADTNNLNKLSLGFPEEIEAVRVWRREGADALLDLCSQSHPLVKAVRNGRLAL